jgi:Transposase IS116/IS110/IS902 family
MTVPGIAWVLGYTIAAEIGDIGRFPTADNLTGYTGLCPRVYQSGPRDRRGPLSKQGPGSTSIVSTSCANHTDGGEFISTEAASSSWKTALISTRVCTASSARAL